MRLDRISELPVSERFHGLKSKLCFESTSWSPTGISDRGNSLLGIAMFSDSSPHFKLFDHVKIHGVSCQFEEAFSLIEILRTSWFLLPILSYTRDRAMVSDIFPSLSLCLVNTASRVFIKWVDECINGKGILVIGWGNLLFLWTVGHGSCAPIGCLHACDSDTCIDDFELSFQDDFKLGVSITTLAGSVTKWSIDLNCSDKQINIGDFQVDNINPSMVQIQQPNPVVLSTVTSTHKVDTFLAVRTRKGIQIQKEPCEFIPSIVEDCLRMLLTAASRYTNSSLLDIARRLADIYLSIERRVASAMIDASDPLASVLSRFTSSGTFTDEMMAISKPDQRRLAFGLHHIYCQIDSVAKSGKNIRHKERDELLSFIHDHRGSDQSVCGICGLMGNRELVGFRLYNVCHQGGHKIPLCMKSLEPIDMNSSETVSECCWCFSIYKTSEGKSCSVCEICRIGLVTPV